MSNPDLIPLVICFTQRDSERDSIVESYLDGKAGGRAILHGRKKSTVEERPTQRELAEARSDEPVYPAGDPTWQWDSDENQAFAQHADRQIAREVAQRQPDLDVNALDDAQRAAVARCSTAEQYNQVAAAIRAGQPMPTFAAAADDRQSIVQLAAPKWSKI